MALSGVTTPSIPYVSDERDYSQEFTTINFLMAHHNVCVASGIYREYAVEIRYKRKLWLLGVGGEISVSNFIYFVFVPIKVQHIFSRYAVTVCTNIYRDLTTVTEFQEDTIFLGFE